MLRTKRHYVNTLAVLGSVFLLPLWIFNSCSNDRNKTTDDATLAGLQQINRDSLYNEEKNKIDSLIVEFKRFYKPQKIYLDDYNLYVEMDVQSNGGYDQVAEGYAMELKENNIKSIRGVAIKNANNGELIGSHPVL